MLLVDEISDLMIVVLVLIPETDGVIVFHDIQPEFPEILRLILEIQICEQTVGRRSGVLRLCILL